VSDPNTPADALTSEELDWIEQQVVIDARTVGGGAEVVRAAPQGMQKDGSHPSL
jgi:hypothetical protein